MNSSAIHAISSYTSDYLDSDNGLDPFIDFLIVYFVLGSGKYRSVLVGILLLSCAATDCFSRVCKFKSIGPVCDNSYIFFCSYCKIVCKNCL
jgi:hypothetical protein